MPDTQIHPQTQSLIDDAHVLGWSVHQHQKGRGRTGFRLVSPLRSDVTIDLPPIRQWNEDKLQTHRERLLRYSDPDKVEHLKSVRAKEEDERAERNRRVQEEAEEAIVQAEQAAQQRAQAAQAEQTASDAPAEERPKPGPPRSRRQPLTYIKEPVVVSKTPWLVRHGKRGEDVVVYPSHAVIQRTWSDDRIDFQCSRCDYASENPLSVTTHYARTKAKHPRRLALPERHVDPNYVAHTPIRPPHEVDEAADSESNEPSEEELESTDISSADPAAVLAQVIGLVAPDLREQTERMRKEVQELQALLEIAESERADAIKARDEAVAAQDKAVTALRNLKAAFSGLEDL